MLYTDWHKYTGIPFKHLGTNKNGMDCVNLCVYVIREELNIDVNVKSSDVCNIVDEDWYNKTNESLFHKAINNNINALEKVQEPKPFDMVLMNIGSTNVPNHCALYLGNSKLLQTMVDHKSWISPYGRYYKQYTTGIYRWKSLIN